MAMVEIRFASNELDHACYFLKYLQRLNSSTCSDREHQFRLELTSAWKIRRIVNMYRNVGALNYKSVFIM